MSNGWDSLADAGRRTYWNANLDMFQFTKFPGMDVELRIVSKPFMFSTHWYYADLIDAWLHANNMEALKAKYNGKLNGKNGPKKRSFECCDYDHDTRRSTMTSCHLCTTYSQFVPYPDKTALFQAFWRIPRSTNPELRNWQKPQTFSFNSAAIKKLMVVTGQQGSDLDDFQNGYSVYVTYNPNQGAATWSVNFCRREALPPQFVNIAQASMVDFQAIYERGNPQDLEQQLIKLGYGRLLDGSYVPPPQYAGGAPQGGYTPHGAPGGYAPQGGYAPPAQHGGYAPQGGFGGAPQGGFNYPTAPAAPQQAQFGGQGGYAAPAQQGGYDDFGAPVGGFGAAPGGFDQGGFGAAPGGFDAAGGFEQPGFEQPGFDQGGFGGQGGFEQPGFDQGGFGGQPSFEQPGFDQGGFGAAPGGFGAAPGGFDQGGFGGQLPPLPSSAPAARPAAPVAPARPSAPPPPARPGVPGAAPRMPAPPAPGAPRPAAPRAPAPPAPGAPRQMPRG